MNPISYFNTNHAKWLCRFCLIKVFLALGGFIFSYVNYINDDYYASSSDPGGFLLLIVGFLISFIVLQVLRSTNKGAWLLKIWYFLLFVLMVIVTALVIIRVITLILAIQRISKEYEMYQFDYDALALPILYNAIIAGIVYYLPMAVLETQYTRWVYKTFKQIQSEVKGNQLYHLPFENYPLQRIVNVKIVFGLIGLAAIIFSPIRPGTFPHYMDLVSIAADSTHRLIYRSLQVTESFSIYLDVFYAVISIIEICLVRFCVQDFYSAHKSTGVGM